MCRVPAQALLLPRRVGLCSVVNASTAAVVICKTNILNPARTVASLKAETAADSMLPRAPRSGKR